MSEVRSPCIDICSLDIDDVCVGCYRTGNEIAEWGMMNDEQKKAVLANCAEREEESGSIFAR